MSHFVEFKMQCDACDRIGMFASQNREDCVSTAIIMPAGWQLITWSFQSGMGTEIAVLCPDCAVKRATQHESWKNGVTP